MYTTEWKSNDPNAEKSKFKFPQGKFENGKTSELRCPVKMCVGPHAAILPPFKPSCQFSGIDNEPGNENTNWYQCPILPNPNFFDVMKDKDEATFFKSNLWRKPHLYGSDSDWLGKAYRYDVSETPAELVSTNKIYMSIPQNDGTVTSTVEGTLVCDRTGGVSQQSEIDDDLIYVCGGQMNTCDTLCELYSRKHKQSAPIEGINSNCINRTIGLNIVQNKKFYSKNKFFKRRRIFCESHLCM